MTKEQTLREEWKEYAIGRLKNRGNFTPEEMMTGVSIEAATYWLDILRREREELVKAIEDMTEKYSAIDGHKIIRLEDVKKLLL